MHQRSEGELDHLPFVVLQLEHFGCCEMMGRWLTAQQQAIIHITDDDGYMLNSSLFALHSSLFTGI